MRNERGITLVELLVTITIMTMISIPVFLIVNNTIKVHQETSIDNQLQHEARFIQQYISGKIRDGAKFHAISGGWELRKGSEVFIQFDALRNEAYLREGNHILTSHVETFTVTPEPVDQPVKYIVALSLKNRDRTFQLKTTVYNDANSRYLK